MFSNIASSITNYIVYVFFISLISFVFLYLYKRVNVLENSLNGICTICHEELNFNKNDIYYSILSCLVTYNKCFYCFAPTVLDCGHVYHHNCLEKWFTYSHDQICPNCGI